MAIIEPPVENDIPTLARMFREDMDDLGVAVDSDQLTTLAAAIVAGPAPGTPQSLCWIARLEPAGEAVGVVLANLNYSLKFAGRALWIEELYVTPKARRNSLGRLLVEQVIDWAEANDIHGVDLEAYQGNTPASVLYRSAGFHRLGRERFYYRIGDTEFL